MNYANLIQNITENIKTNGSQAITAQVLQDVLVDMVGELGQSGALLGGVIDTSFVPDPTNDAQVVYIAEAPGTYTNFNGLVVGAGEVAFFYFDGNAWAKSSVDVLEVVNDLNSTATDKALSAAMGKQLQDSLTQAVQDLTTAIGNKADASALAAKADKVVDAVAGNMAALDADGNLVDSGVAASAVGDVANKADKVAGATADDLAALDASGNLIDSGVPVSSLIHGGVVEAISEALAEQDARLDGLESHTDRKGDLKADTLDSTEVPKVCATPMVLIGAGTPSASVVPDNWNADTMGEWTGIPCFIGQLYVNKNASTNGLYVAKNTTAVNGWITA